MFSVFRSPRQIATIIGLVLLGGTAVHPTFRPYLVLFLLNGLVLTNAVLLYTNLSRSRTWTDAILGVTVIALSQITVTELYLGLAGHLTLFAVSTAQAGCLGLTVACIRMGWLTAPSGVACRRAAVDLMRAGLEVVTGSRATILACAVACCVFAFVFGISSLNPPISFDALFFHLIQPVEWLQSGSIPIQLVKRYSYPHGIGLMTVWLLLPFHHDFITRFSQIPFILLGFLAGYGICRNLGIERRLAIITAAAVLTIPEYLANGIALTNPDTQIAGMVLIALYCALSLAQDYRFSTLLLLALSLGLVLSAKYTAVYYGVPLIPLLIYGWYRGRRNQEHTLRWRLAAWLHALLLLIVPLVIGGMTYLYDLSTTHRLYPFNYDVLLSDAVPAHAQTIPPFLGAFRLTSFALSPASLKNAGASVLIGLSAIVFLVYRLIRRYRQWRGMVLPVFVTFPLLFSLLIYLRFGYYPGAAATRHLLATLALCVILAGWMVAQVGERGQAYGTWGLVGVTIIASFLGFMRQWPVHRIPTRILATVLAVTGGIIIWRLLTAVRAGHRFPTRFVAVISSPSVLLFSGWLVLLGLHGWERAYRAHKYGTWPTWFGFGTGWAWIADVTADQGVRIAHNVYLNPLHGNHGLYPLYGYDLQNKLIPLSAKLILGESTAQQTQRLREWEQELIRRQIDYVYLFALWTENQRERFKIETEWVESHPETFLPVFYGGNEYIYRINPSRQAAR